MTHHSERRCGDRRATDRRVSRSDEPKYWLSPGARLWLAGVSCVLALGVVFLLIPFYRDRGQREDQHKQDVVLRASQRAQGQRLLQGFDCTYGRGVRLTLKEAARSSTVSAHVALQARHNALARGDRKAAHRSLISYRNSRAAARKYRSVAASLKPLADPPPKCPPR